MENLFKHKTEIKVQFEDIDAFKVVNNCKYFNFFERARIDYIRTAGTVNNGEDSIENYECAVVENYCSYKKPAVFDDDLTILIRMSFVKRTSLQFQYIIKRYRDNAVIATGYSNLVWVSLKEKKTKVFPPALKKAVIDFEADSLGTMTGMPDLR